MSYVISLLKHTLSEFVIMVRKLLYRNGLNEKYEIIANEIKNNGFYTFGKLIDKEACRSYRRLIDNHINNEDCNIWKDESCADKRIYFIDEIHNEFGEIAESSVVLSTLKAYLGYTNPVYMVLAARLDAVENNLGSGGGWHRDSPYQHQFKALIYLNDVNPSNGPFEFVPGSHKFRQCSRAELHKTFEPGAFRYRESEIQKYNDKYDSAILPLLGSSGDMTFVDTKLLHRGRPIEKGSRYVLFLYYWNNKVPTHFEKYRQVK